VLQVAETSFIEKREAAFIFLFFANASETNENVEALFR